MRRLLPQVGVPVTFHVSPFKGEVLELVEQAGLENRCTFTGTVGSNPTLSARKKRSAVSDSGLWLNR